MSEVLARLRVKEEHGIRRFLYPLSAQIMLPPGTDLPTLSLVTEQGDALPLQVNQLDGERHRLDFAISLDPFQLATDLILSNSGTQTTIPDPLGLTFTENGELSGVQERFQVALGQAGEIKEVVYDGVPHLREPAVITRHNPDDNHYKRGLGILDETETPIHDVIVTTGGGPISAWSTTTGVYEDGCAGRITSEITACKSWISLHYRLEQPRPSEVVTFSLPLSGAITSPARSGPERVIFDTGIDAIYGRLTSYFGSFLRWKMSDGDTIRWEIGAIADGHMLDKQGNHADRIDYAGRTQSENFQQQRWFHLVDGNKAIAVAITLIPSSCHSIEVNMRSVTTIRFTLAEHNEGPAEFGVCYHFLNDIPAIAAATNPQSILLPPTVEVLPL